jgi:helix-turn-helix protein
LEAIAESTKIRPSLLLALENGDIAKLPRGIFRRGFLRAYAKAIGVHPESLLTELSRLSGPGPDFDRSASGGMRLTLEPESPLTTAPGRRVLAAIGDTGAILLIAAAIAPFTGVSQWAIIGLIGLIYYALGTACLGRTLGTWCLARGWSSNDDGQPGRPHRRWGSFLPHWLDDLVRRSATPAGSGGKTSPIDPSAEPASAHSHGARP